MREEGEKMMMMKRVYLRMVLWLLVDHRSERGSRRLRAGWPGTGVSLERPGRSGRIDEKSAESEKKKKR